MDRDGLSSLFRRVLLAGGLLLSGCDTPATCPRVEMTIPVSPELPGAAADGGLENDLVLCEADVSACHRLCQKALPLGADGYTLNQCHLVKVDGGFAVHVVYTMACPG
jgi:hypothetical protein